MSTPLLINPRMRLIGLAALVLPLHLSAEEVRFSETATGAATWRLATNWDNGVVPTADDDVVFDYANTTTITSMALHTAPNDTFVARSLTFGSSVGPALGAFELRNGNTGSTNRTLTLTTGAITVASQVTGTQTMRTTQGKTTLLAVDHSFEVENNSSQQFIINSYFADNGQAATLTLGTAGGGTITLGGINTHTGGTIVKTGASVALASSSAISNGTVSVAAGATLDLVNTLDIRTAGLEDFEGGAGVITRSNTSNNRKLILDGAGSYSFSGVLQTSGTANNSHFQLEISGGGTQRLSGASTYGGITTVVDGTLLANNSEGSATGTGNVSVGALGVLGGTGSVARAISESLTAEFSPGDNGAGTLTVTGNLDVTNGATFKFDLGAQSDLIVVGGTLTGSANAGEMVFDFTGLAGVSAGVSYTLFDYTVGSISGLDVTDFALSSGSISAGFALDTTFGVDGWLIDTDNKLVQVRFLSVPEVASIPEPSTAAVLAGVLALGCGAGLRRRRRHV